MSAPNGVGLSVVELSMFVTLIAIQLIKISVDYDLRRIESVLYALVEFNKTGFN